MLWPDYVRYAFNEQVNGDSDTPSLAERHLQDQMHQSGKTD